MNNGQRYIHVANLSTLNSRTDHNQVYDTDGNILQAVDDHLLPSLLSQAYTYLSNGSLPPFNKEITITELGAGTGRNTAKLLLPLSASASDSSNLNPEIKIKTINALDLSPSMLSLAEKRCTSLLAQKPLPIINFHVFDALNQSNYPEVKEKVFNKADLVISTLVLEHLPLEVFFSTVRSLLLPPSSSSKSTSTFSNDTVIGKTKNKKLLVLTNMHKEMGDISQAGFIREDTNTGERVKMRGTSYSYSVEEMLDEAEKWGFEVLGGDEGRGVREWMVKEEDVGEDEDGKEDGGGGDGSKRLLGKRGRKWIGVKVWFGCVLRLCDEGE